MKYDVVIVGGGPAGLQAALSLGRARKRVLLCDAGPRRNAAAARVHNFVTRDGTPPEEFRREARAQLLTYPNVEVRDEGARAIEGAKGAFQVQLGAGHVEARRVLLCTGMVDELPPLEGLRERWGSAVFQCPYCHGWEVQERAFGYLPRAGQEAHLLPFALQLRGWSSEVVVFTQGELALDEEARAALAAAGVRLEEGRVGRLLGADGALEAVELEGGARVRCEALFTHPPQRQVELVRALGLELDGDGFVKADPMMRTTSTPGIYAAGDLTTRMQAAIAAAGAGLQAAAVINAELTAELALSGAL